MQLNLGAAPLRHQCRHVFHFAASRHFRSQELGAAPGPLLHSNTKQLQASGYSTSGLAAQLSKQARKAQAAAITRLS